MREGNVRMGAEDLSRSRIRLLSGGSVSLPPSFPMPSETAQQILLLLPIQPPNFHFINVSPLWPCCSQSSSPPFSLKSRRRRHG